MDQNPKRDCDSFTGGVQGQKREEEQNDLADEVLGGFMAKFGLPSYNM